MNKRFVAAYVIVITIIVCFMTSMSFGIGQIASSYNKKDNITLETKSKIISLRIEGESENLFYNNKYKINYEGDSVSILDLLDEAIGSTNYVALNSYYGGEYIVKIYDEEENSIGDGVYDGWQYCVNGVTPSETIDTYKLQDNDEVVIYYGGIETQYPKKPQITYDNNNVVIEFKADGYDDNWNVIIKPVVGAKVKLEDKEYITNNEGKISIPYNEIDNKEYKLQIEKYDESLPLVVRFAEDFKIKIDKLDIKKEDTKSILVSDDYIIDADIKKFDDIEDDRVSLLVSMGIVKGETDNKFYPNNNITRAEFITLLAKLSGEKITTSQKEVFNDVPINEWYFDTIMWGYNKGIVNGYQSRFEPDSFISREDMSLMIIKYLEKVEEYKIKNIEVKFNDNDDMYEYSKNAIANLVDLGLVNGKPNNIFDPKGYATRYETVTVLTNFLDLKYDDVTFDKKKEVKSIKIDKTKIANYLLSTVTNPSIGQLGGEWTIIALKDSGIKVPEQYYEQYYKTVEDAIKSKNGELSRNKYTEYSRIVLALSAIKKDSTNVVGYNLIEKIKDTDKVINQGITGAAYALAAFNTVDYKTSESELKLLSYIKKCELKEGGFSLVGENADPDVTAMVLQALAYYNGKEIDEIKERAIKRLSEMQNEKGGFSTNSSESISQVIKALSELNIDINTDKRFVKDGNTLLNALYDYYDEERGAFKHDIEGDINLMATEQALLAIESI